jgi:serine/threonine protein kinase
VLCASRFATTRTPPSQCWSVPERYLGNAETPMNELLKFLSTNSHAALAFGLAVLILSATVSVICVVAFAQGRAISFWPPSIGERPRVATLQIKDSETDGEDGDGANSSNPVIGRGTRLRGASGKTYKVSSALYGGAQATLYKAEDDKHDAVIAKVYWRGLAPNSPPWELFRQEQRTADILSHRNIVKVLDRGLRSAYPFTIIEYFGGGTLRDWLRTHQALPGRDIASIASQLADGIDYAHSRGVIHRDIKPGNILFESDPYGRVALADFGIAAIMGAVQRDITAVGGEFSGSPAYLAPEVISAGVSTTASDIYSFGIVVFEMIAAHVPFDERQDPLAIIKAKVERDVPDVREFKPDIPENVANQLSLVLARNHLLRPSSARAALAVVSDWLVSKTAP